MSAPGPSAGELLGELVAVLGDALGVTEDDIVAGYAWRPDPTSAPVLPFPAMRQVPVTASALTRCARTGDMAGAERMLSAPRTLPEWRALVLTLAKAADPRALEAAERAAA